jgi:hypothetical protein
MISPTVGNEIGADCSGNRQRCTLRHKKSQPIVLILVGKYQSLAPVAVSAFPLADQFAVDDGRIEHIQPLRLDFHAKPPEYPSPDNEGK